MAAAATNAVYSQVFKKKLADVFRVGAGGGLCFCGINMYFKNDKFYDDWVMPLFNRMEPETAYAVAKQAAKYKLVSKEKLQESRLLVSSQPSSRKKTEHERALREDEESSHAYGCLGSALRGSSEDLICHHDEIQQTPNCQSMCHARVCDSETEPDETSPGLYIEDTSSNSDLKEPCAECGACHQDIKCLNGEAKTNSASKTYYGDIGHYRSDLRACDSPKSERNCVTPDSPSLSMRVNIASPLRSSKMSLATMIDGSNPVYDRDQEVLDLFDSVDGESCYEGECNIICEPGEA
ncbi:uncharacterized protein [Panulirus ornatus]|uniref:uncharacterized protein n=1 Tax=Panulirus ornatus TaxID=150431 RepID=UPI003A837209